MGFLMLVGCLIAYLLSFKFLLCFPALFPIPGGSAMQCLLFTWGFLESISSLAFYYHSSTLASSLRMVQQLLMALLLKLEMSWTLDVSWALVQLDHTVGRLLGQKLVQSVHWMHFQKYANDFRAQCFNKNGNVTDLRGNMNIGRLQRNRLKKLRCFMGLTQKLGILAVDLPKFLVLLVLPQMNDMQDQAGTWITFLAITLGLLI